MKRSNSQRSVTLLHHHDDLPSYSCERFYLLGELRLHAYRTILLSDNLPSRSDDTVTTIPDEEEEGERNIINPNRSNALFPPFTLLYLLWIPDSSGPGAVQHCVEQEILPAVRQLQEQLKEEAGGKIVPSRPETGNSGDGVTEEKKDDVPGVPDSTSKNTNDISVYLVLDRLVTDNDERSFTDAQTDAELLVRQVAQHVELRQWCDGITVGVANHERAAPGLEAIVTTVQYGASTRRKYDKTNSLSYVGVVARTERDFLGIQDKQITDAAEDIRQWKVSAEWCGQGTMQSVAERALVGWKRARGIVEIATATSASQKRRRGAVTATHALYTPGQDDEVVTEQFLNVLVIALLVMYLGFHLRRDEAFREWILASGWWSPKYWEDWVLALLR